MKRLLFLSIIAALVFWASQSWENKTAVKNLESSDPHYIDVFIQDFTLTAMTAEGKPAYVLKAKRFEHYNDGDYAIIMEPTIELKQGKQHWLINAKSGEIDDNRQSIILRGSVVLQQQGETQPIRLETEQLEIDNHQQIVKSMQTVSIIQQEFNLQSEGMILNNATGEIELLNGVKGSHVQTQ